MYPPALTYFYCCIEVAITISSLGFIAVCNARFLLDADSKRQCDDWCLNSICRSTGGQFHYIYFSLNPLEYYNIFSHDLNMVPFFHLSNSILTLFSSCDEHVVLLKKIHLDVLFDYMILLIDCCHHGSDIAILYFLVLTSFT